MRIPPVPHPWSLSPKEAIALQRDLAALVEHRRPRKRIQFVAGTDAAFTSGGKCIAAAILWDCRERIVVEEHIATRDITFPYVPGLLSFREAPAVLAALEKLGRTPDGLILDGHGWAHPRRFGIACHVGFLCGLPTIGCAKSLLIGDYCEPGRKRGSRTALRDGDLTIGTVLRTRDGVKPVFVSVGHKMDLPTAEELVLDCAVRYRLPEPTRLADRLVAAAKRKARSI